MVIAGDILHSRVARSNIWGLTSWVQGWCWQGRNPDTEGIEIWG